jgi:hypothetical protein
VLSTAPVLRSVVRGNGGTSKNKKVISCFSLHS